MVSRVIKMAFWVTYDHLGKLMLAGLLWSSLAGIPGYLAIEALLSPSEAIRLALGIPLALFACVAGVPMGAAAAAEMVKELIDTRDGSVGTFLEGLRKHAVSATALGAVYGFVAASLAASVWFYPAVIGPRIPMLGYALGAIALWLLVFAGMTALMVMPVLVQRKGRIVATVKLAAVLVLANPGLALALTVQAVCWTVFCLLVPPLLVVLYGPCLVVLGSSAYEMLSRKYNAGEAGETADRNDDYLNRGLRDFFFPWKG
ncbi:MAG: hypothetical protein AMXMBFR84_02940 [Candidatus Hydrogenedentota bacterium]